MDDREDRQPSTAPQKKNRVKVIPLILLALALLAILWFARYSSSPKPPAQSTSETRPNSEQNVPDEGNGSVTQGENPEADTAPSPSGAGANTLMNQ